MTTDKEFVENIMEQMGRPGMQAVCLHGTLKSLSSAIYANADRFVYELLQNACDAASDTTGGAVSVTLHEDSVLSFCHDGTPFSRDDVHSLCSAGESTKTGEILQIGYKGIGFKSVFGHSSWVAVRSGNFSFRFDREHWKGEQIPWQVVPIWTDAESIPGPALAGDLTGIVLRLDNGAAVTDILTKMTEHPEFVLFLSALKSLRIEAGGIVRTISKHPADDILEIRVDGECMCRYLIREYQRDVSPEVRSALELDHDIPKKMKGISIVPICFALPIGADGKPLGGKQPLYSYFPMNVRIGLELLVNSLFHTIASRETFSQDHPLNKFIICESAVCMTEWLAEMALNPDRRADMLVAVPDEVLAQSSLAKTFDTALRAAFSATPCLPDASGSQLLLVGAGVHDSAGLLAAIGANSFVTPDGIARQRIHASLRSIDRLHRFGVKQATVADLPRIVTQFSEPLKVAETNLALALQLQSHVKSLDTIKRTRWLLSSDGRLLFPGELFWPPEDPGAADSLPEDLPQLNALLIHAAEGNPAFKSWLTQTIGVAFVEPAAIVRSFLLPRLKAGPLPEGQSLPWLRIAFRAHQAKGLEKAEYLQLGALQVNTRDGAGKPAKDCWLGLPYFNDKGWDSLTRNQPIFYFVADEYAEYGGGCNAWREFFESIGTPPVRDCVKIRLLALLNKGNTPPEERREFWTVAAFKAYSDGALEKTAYPSLGGLPLATKRGGLKPAKKCWLGQPYATEINWENLLGGRPDFDFVGESYPQLEGSPGEWGRFFRDIGVIDDIEFVAAGDLTRKQLSNPGYLALIDAEGNIAPAEMQWPHRHKIEGLYGINIQLAACKDERGGYQLGERFVKKALSSAKVLPVKYTADRHWYPVPSYIRFLLRKFSVWPGNDKKCHLASELIIESPENRDILGDDIPSIDAENLGISPKILVEYGCKRAPDTKQCLWLLNTVAERGDVGAASKERIRRIYRRLENIRISPQRLDVEAVKAWAAGAAILSAADTFCNPSMLFIAADAELLPLYGREEYAFGGDLTPNEAFRLLIELGVTPAGTSEIDIVTSHEHAAPELLNILRDRRHLLALLAIGPQATPEALAGSEVVSFLELLQCFRVESYELHQAGTDRTKAGSTLSYLRAGTKQLYFMGSEKDLQVVYAIAQELARVLRRPELAQGIDLMLRLSVQEGRNWLARERYDISVLPAVNPLPAAVVPEIKPPVPIPAPAPKSSLATDFGEPAVYLPELRELCSADRYCATQDPAVTRDFAARLLAALGEQKSTWAGYIYHFTHVENLISVLKDRAIKSRARTGSFSDSAGQSLIAHTSDAVKGFARFYFRPLTPTQWHNECLGRSHGSIRALCPVPVFIRLPVGEVLARAGSRCAVSNGNMASPSSHFGNHPDFLDHFDAINVHAKYCEIPWLRFMAASQQEFLVRDELSLAGLPLTLICRNNQDLTTLRYLLDLHGIQDFRQAGEQGGNRIVVDPSLYFLGDTPSLEVRAEQGRVAAELKNGHLLGGTLRLRAKAPDSERSSQEVSSILAPGGVAPPLDISFDRRLGMTGFPEAEVTIHYEEAGTQWLVYGGIIDRTPAPVPPSSP